MPYLLFCSFTTLARQQPYISPLIFHSWLLNKPHKHCRKSATTTTTCALLIDDHWHNKCIVNCRIVKLTVNQMPFGRRSAEILEPQSTAIFSAKLYHHRPTVVHGNRVKHKQRHSSQTTTTTKRMWTTLPSHHWRRLPVSNGTCNSTQGIGLGGCGESRRTTDPSLLTIVDWKHEHALGSVKYVAPRETK